MDPHAQASPFYSAAELMSHGFESVGKNPRVSRKCSLYAIQGRLGDNVRIDDFCILKGRVFVGSFVHIAAFCSVSGTCGDVRIGDFSGLANRVSVYTGTDDYSADALSGPTVPQEYVVTKRGDVTIGRGVIVGAHSVVLPGVRLEDVCTVGALCLVSSSVGPGHVCVSGAGRPKIARTRNVDSILAKADAVMSAWTAARDEM